jgi:hypothetical protein
VLTKLVTPGVLHLAKSPTVRSTESASRPLVGFDGLNDNTTRGLIKLMRTVGV